MAGDVPGVVEDVEITAVGVALRAADARRGVKP